MRHASTTAASCDGTNMRSGLVLPSTRRLEASDPGPPPTCPFILTNNAKERKPPALPLNLFYQIGVAPEIW